VADTIPKRLFEQAKARGDASAYLYKQHGVWKAVSWRDYGREVTAAARALIALGFEKGQRTCILGFNRPEWVLLDLATMAAGGAPAGIYTTCSPDEVQYIVSHSEAPLVLVENEAQWQKIEKKRAELPLLKYVVFMRGTTPPAKPENRPTLLSWDDFLARGATTSEKEVLDRVEALEPSDLATLIYTSGTTGPPKAVMLTHENLAWTASVLRDLTKIEAGGRSLSYLPLSHIAEQMATIHGPITGGACVYYAESIEKIADNLKEVRPTLFFGVPRIWEKFYAAIQQKMGQATGAKARVAKWARGVGERVTRLRCEGKEPSGVLAIEYRLADRLVFTPLKEAIGLDQASCLVSGAAPIGKEVLAFFGTLDVFIQEIYGQSEDTGPTSFNLMGRTKIGSVGVVLPGVTVKLGDDGEILVRGPNVFAGYFKDAAATKDTLTDDGWLRSGDLGQFDADGFLFITGRKKEIIITAGGKNITPKNIEELIKECPLLSEAVVIGDRRKFLSALVWLEPEATQRWMRERGASGDPANNGDVRAEIQKAIDRANEKLARVEQVKKFAIGHRPLGIDTGELTPTLKVKRSKVAAHFAAQIDAMYEGEGGE
jgi:long-chain acyl-CoA synthetase